MYRAGELGLNEAIIPLERPDVLSKVGAAIGAEVSGIGSQDAGSSVTYVLFTDDAIAQLDSLLATRLLNNKDAMEVAIRGAVAAITEALHTMSESANSKQDDMLAKITALSKEHLEAASQNASEIIDAIDAAADSISSAVGNISFGSNLGFGGAGIGSTSGGSSSGGTRYPDHWYTEDGETVDFATVVKDTGSVSNAFKELGYEKNENGHWTKPKGSARGSLVTKDALYRAGELGLNEAIIPLERPDVLSKVGAAIGSSMPSIGSSDTASTAMYALFTEETLAQLSNAFNPMLLTNKDAMEIAIRGATSAITEALSQTEHTQEQSFNNVVNVLEDSTREVIEQLDDSTGAIRDSIDDAASSITSAIGKINISVGSNLGGGFGAGSSSGSGSKPGGVIGNIGSIIGGPIGGVIGGPVGSIVGGTIGGIISGVVGGLTGKKNTKSKIKGSARGSLITEDALYRAGEFGLNEAIIPLERPDVLSQVGSAIAAFMPQDRYKLQAVSGMTNAGVTALQRPVNPVVQQMNADAMVQRVLEAVLPQIAFATASNNDDDRRPLYVGTLIADERGLQALERRLYDIRVSESSRR